MRPAARSSPLAISSQSKSREITARQVSHEIAHDTKHPDREADPACFAEDRRRGASAGYQTDSRQEGEEVEESRSGEMKRIEVTAYHEAGHAICSLLQDVSFKHVTIKPNKADGSRGECKSSRRAPANIEYDDSPRMRQWIESEVIIFAGGYVAQQFFAKKRIFGGAKGDWYAIFDLLSLHSRSMDEISAHHALLTIRARNLLLQPLSWRMVEAVAKELLQRHILKFKEARDIAMQASNALLSSPDDAQRLRREIADYCQRFPIRLSGFTWSMAPATNGAAKPMKKDAAKIDAKKGVAK